MATAMDEAQRSELEEDLTVQHVILSSLEKETFDGVEEERLQAIKEIERLKAILNQPRQSQAPEQHGDASQPLQTNRNSPAQSRRSSPALPNSPDEARRTSSSGDLRRHPATVSTPRKQTMDNNIWSSPVSRSLPSRKREFGSTSLASRHDPAKSQRTTPTPAGSSHYPASSQSIEIVDLTGSDVEQDATCIAEQIKAENRFKQEVQDRRLAQQLSQGSEPGPSSQGSSGPPRQDALSRLMATQRANARGLSGPSDSMAGISGSRYQPPALENPTASMPGAYDSSWDQPPAFGFAPPTGGHGFATAPSTPQAQAQAYNPYASSLSAGFPHGAAALPGYWPGYSHSLHTPSSGPLHGVQQQPVGPPFMSPSLRTVPSLPSMGGSSLMDAISRSNMVDYSTMQYQNGQALPDRLSDFLQEAYHDPRVTEKELDELLQNIRPDMDIPERNRDGTPAGLKGALYLHQELALSWMKKMEDGSNKGGILADDMGLGKTISTLALMLDRPHAKRPKTNLIIGPLSLIRQWEDELKTKTKSMYRMSVFVYHNTKASSEDLLQHDVVLTTYMTVANEWKRLQKYLAENRDRTLDLNDHAHSLKFPLLHPDRAEFHRVILDEAQYIKNDKTRTAQACHNIKATYRWCLTGTPMMNGVRELYSLVKFLRIRPYCHWEQFRESFGRLMNKKGVSAPVAIQRLRALLRAIMLRRKKDSELEGKPILNLPSKTEEVVHAELSPDERHFYKQLEERSQVQFSKYLRDGSIGKNYSNILVLLLRMRQACCHPHLNVDVDDVAPLNVSNEEIVTLVKGLAGPVVERIKAMEAFECPICFDAVQSPSFFVPCGHDSCKDCLVRLVDNAMTMTVQSGEDATTARCPVCRGSFDPKKCFSLDTFREIHMPETVVKKSEPDAEDAEGSENDDDDSDSETDDDADDVDSKGNLRGFIVDDESDDADDVKSTSAADGIADGAAKKQKKKKSGKKKEKEIKPSMLKSLRIEAAKNQAAYKTYMRYLRKTWMPSAKVTACMELLKKILAAKEKAIVFSQWTLMLDLLQVAMWHEGFDKKPLRYDGSMTGDQRAQAARDFKTKPESRVMLVSLRAGNAGLNLTSANNVIIMDPFWNPYIEMQAVDRAYRIGQSKDVKVHRILTQETVEDRIMELQEQKKEIVEAALNETESMKIGRLNVNELKFLFNGRN